MGALLSRRRGIWFAATSLALAAMTLAAAGSPLMAQRVLPPQPACESCRVRTELAADLRGDAIDQVRTVRRDARGRFWLLSSNAARVPEIFAGNGTYIGPAARSGDGPGEMRSGVAVLDLAGDSVGVLELTGRFHFLGPTLEYGRSVQLALAGHVDPVIAASGDRVVFSQRPPAGGAGALWSLSLVDDNAAAHALDQRGDFVRHVVAATGDGGFWSAPIDIADLTRWSAALEPVDTIMHRPAWFRSRSDLATRQEGRQPSPRVAGLVEDDNGLLWLFTLRPAPAQERGGRARNSSREQRLDDDAWARSWHTYADVIDTASRRILARHALDRGPIALLPGPIAVFVLSERDGTPYLRAVRFRLLR
jgi:hypothetical protein